MKKKVLFVCIENSCRSQMAEGFAGYFGSAVLDAYSAGSKPSGKINPVAIRVMREAGRDISRQKSKGFDGLSFKEFDYVVTLGCQDTCPFVPAGEHIEWHIEDPKGKSTDYFREVRNKIRHKVINLIKRLSRKCESEAGDGKTF
jgi:arsenate reductase